MSFETLPASAAAWNIIKQIKAAADTFERTKGFLIKLMSEVMTLHYILQLSDQEASLSQQGRGMFGHTQSAIVLLEASPSHVWYCFILFLWKQSSDIPESCWATKSSNMASMKESKDCKCGNCQHTFKSFCCFHLVSIYFIKGRWSPVRCLLRKWTIKWQRLVYMWKWESAIKCSLNILI